MSSTQISPDLFSTGQQLNTFFSDYEKQVVRKGGTGCIYTVYSNEPVSSPAGPQGDLQPEATGGLWDIMPTLTNAVVNNGASRWVQVDVFKPNSQRSPMGSLSDGLKYLG
jgi:hypothetical protein